MCVFLPKHFILNFIGRLWRIFYLGYVTRLPIGQCRLSNVQANLRHAIAPGQQVALQAQVAIPAGTELTIRYTHMLQPHLRRRAQIEVSILATREIMALV